MRTKFKAWAPPLIEEHKELAIKVSDIKELATREVTFIEIGSGKGRFMSTIALHHPEINCFAMERDVTCAGFLLKKIIENPHHNAYLLYDDFEKVYEDMPLDFFDVIFLNFPDPWPKKKHEKRRLTALKNIERMAKLIKPHGYLILKTDNDGLFEFSKKTFDASSLSKVKVIEDYKVLSLVDESTEYELKFREKGQSIHRIIYQKR